MAINLLPTYLTPKSGAFRLNNFLKIASVGSLVILIVSGVIFLALFLINSFQIQSQIKKNEALKQNILNLEQAETRYVLVKDRLEKAKTILSEGEIFKKTESISQVVNSSSLVSISELNIAADRVDFTINTSSTAGVTEFSKNLLANETFTKINMSDFSFSPTTGYTITYQAF